MLPTANPTLQPSIQQSTICILTPTQLWNGTAQSAIYDLLRAIDRKQEAILVLLDFSAAFDTNDHVIFLWRLPQRYVIGGTALNWFRSYLQDQWITLNQCPLERQSQVLIIFATESHRDRMLVHLVLLTTLLRSLISSIFMDWTIQSMLTTCRFIFYICQKVHF